MGGFLEIFLYFNIFLMGALAALAIQHAYAHFKPHPREEVKPRRPAPPSVHVPPEMKQQLLETAQTRLQTELERSVNDLQRDLGTTTAQLNKQLEKLGTEIVKDEMNRYHDNIDQLRHQANTSLAAAQSNMAAHQQDLEARMTARQQELEAKLNEEMAAEKERLTTQLDTRLGDAVASFLTETLQHNVDLGSQSTYLTAQLEAHKDELKRGLSK